MNDYKELLRINDEILQESLELGEDKLKIYKSMGRTKLICENNQTIISDIENKFLVQTKLRRKDIPFLFVAIALQTLRWMLLPSLDMNYSQISKEDRLNANDNKKSGPLAGKKSGQRYEKPEIYKEIHKDNSKYQNEVEEYRKKINGQGKYNYKSWLEILMHPVPYDAMLGSEKISIVSHNILGKVTFNSPIGKQLVGKNHHVATLGHDPVLGWIFGTLNILSSRITFCDLQTYPVIQSVQLDKWTQEIDYLNTSSIGEMIIYSIESVKEDGKRLPAAIARQAIHMQSDKYTKDGLQIPLLTPDKAQKLIDSGWNSNEAERILSKILKNAGVVASQYIVAELINTIIKWVYLLMFSEEDININKVRVEKILALSSIIAETSNIVTVAITRDISKLDIGGLISMVHQIATSKEVQLEIEMEYIRNEFRSIVMEDV